jgi:hypothetical protein
MHARASLDLRYADLFRQLNLTPAQLEKLKALLVERDTARSNVTAVAASSGLNLQQNSAEIQRLVEQAQREIEASIAQTIGAERYATFQNYQQTSTQRYTVKQLEHSLSYTSTPLNAAQPAISPGQPARPHLRRPPSRLRRGPRHCAQSHHHRRGPRPGVLPPLPRPTGGSARNENLPGRPNREPRSSQRSGARWQDAGRKIGNGKGFTRSSRNEVAGHRNARSTTFSDGCEAAEAGPRVPSRPRRGRLQRRRGGKRHLQHAATFGQGEGTIRKVLSTASAARTLGSVPRPNCHATTVTVMGNRVRGGRGVRCSRPSRTTAGPSRT